METLTVLVYELPVCRIVETCVLHVATSAPQLCTDEIAHSLR